MFTYELACQMSDRFAAIASYAGTMPVSPASCDISDGIAMMHIHGELDGIIAYNNAWDWKEWDSVGTMQAIPDLVDYWGDKNQVPIGRRDFILAHRAILFTPTAMPRFGLSIIVSVG